MHLYADSTLAIDLHALTENYHTLAKHAKGAKCAAVVKANAYGLGVEPVSKTLYHAGCKHFFVATLDEAIELRQFLPTPDIAIYVFHGCASGQEDVFKAYNIVPVLNGFRQVLMWQQAAHTQRLPCVLHVDTGMNRLGLSIEDLTQLAQHEAELKKIDIRFIMTHLVAADTPRSKKNAEQLKQCEYIKTLFPHTALSVSNSAGIFLGEDYHFELVRPGCALYGITPTAKAKKVIKPVVKLTSKINQLRTVKKGATIGYNGTYTLKKDAMIATIPVGYADGYFRHLSNTSYVVMHNTKLPVVGRVSMDMITVDVTDISHNNMQVGSEVELIGNTITVNDIAHWADTIGYEVLTSLGNRYKRVYRSA